MARRSRTLGCERSTRPSRRSNASKSSDPNAPEFDAELRQLERAVMTHAEHEEHEEFPGVRQARSEDQLKLMVRAITAAEAIAPTHPHPRVPPATTTRLLAGPFAAMADRVRDVVRQAMQG